MRNLDNTDGSNQRFLQHLSLEHYSKILSSNEWANLIKVSIVRNPWDRLVSFYEYNLQSHGRMGTKGKSFKDWFYKRSISPTLIPYISVNNQIPNNLRLIRFEKYSEDMDSFFTDIGLKFDRKVHEKKTKRLSYRSYYTSKMQRDLEKECEKDIEYFNFTF